MSGVIADWTSGVEAIAYQACAACGARQYFQRSFCSACGSADLQSHRARGDGVVYAVTLVCRAATPEARAHLPYVIVLVDTAEGFRIMAHGDAGLTIGDKVTTRFADFTGHLVPHFERTTA